MHRERKVVWVYLSESPERCLVRIIDKYISLLPPVKTSTKRFNFYLHSLEKYTPAQWYGEQVVGRNTLCKTISDICKDAKIDGFRTNHSLRRTGTTRLFQHGVDHKLIKEFTGHTSDAVDAYQVTSKDQHREMSKILTSNNYEKQKGDGKKCVGEVEIALAETSGKSPMSCVCNKEQFDIDKSEKLGSLFTQIVSACKGGKAKIKLEIEFSD